MKTKLTILLTLCSFLGLMACHRMDTDKKKYSYAVGKQIGQNFKNQNLEIDPEYLAEGLKEVADGKDPKDSKLTPQETQAILQKMNETRMNRMTKEANEHLAKAKEFLEKNKTEKDVKTTPSGLQYVVVSEGSGRSPKPTDRVKVNYTGTLVDGKEFDSSGKMNKGQPVEFALSNVVKGWAEGLQLIKKGGKVKLFVPPELGYGPTTRPNIPSNSVLVFDVELVDVMDAPPAPVVKPLPTQMAKTSRPQVSAKKKQ